jgi:hypothetical protein
LIFPAQRIKNCDPNHSIQKIVASAAS